VRSEMASGLSNVRSEMASGLADVRSEVAHVRKEMGSGLDGLRKEMASGLDGVRSEMGSGLDGVRSEVADVRSDTRALNSWVEKIEEHVRDVAKAAAVSDVIIEMAGSFRERIEFGENRLVREIKASEARLGERIEAFRGEFAEHRSTVEGHGIQIAELGERVTRLERPAS